MTTYVPTIRERVLEHVRRLSPREREVAVLLGEGLTSKEAARRLGNSVRTIECHRNHIFKKLNVRNVAQLAVRMYQAGMLQEASPVTDMPKRWTPEENAVLHKHYKTRGADWCADHLGRTLAATRFQASRIGAAARKPSVDGVERKPRCGRA